MTRIRLYKNKGAVVFDPNNPRHQIEIDSDVVGEMDDTEKNRKKYFGIKPEVKNGRSQKIKLA